MCQKIDISENKKEGKKMNKIEIVENPVQEKEVAMEEMPLGSIGRIVSSSEYKGIIVRRTCSSFCYTVEELSRTGKDYCWTYKDSNLRVVLLPDAKIIVQL
jgi:hypothetical protein